MCRISDKLKLCTCGTKELKDLDNYWILYKFRKSNIIMMGDPVLPGNFYIGEENNEYNRARLAELLNEGNCFDVDLPLSNRDILEIRFSCPSKVPGEENISLVYEFVFRHNKWTSIEYDPFDDDRLEKEKGEIRNLFD